MGTGASRSDSKASINDIGAGTSTEGATDSRNDRPSLKRHDTFTARDVMISYSHADKEMMLKLKGRHN